MCACARSAAYSRFALLPMPMAGLEQIVSISWGCSLYSWLCGEARRSSLRTTQVQNMQAENIFGVEL